MTGWDWLQMIYLATVLALLVATVRTHRIGGRKMIVMVLAWLCIFMVAAGIAGFFGERLAEPAMAPPQPEGDPILT